MPRSTRKENIRSMGYALDNLLACQGNLAKVAATYEERNPEHFRALVRLLTATETVRKAIEKTKQEM